MEDLPKGFRFFPTEEELVSFYLQNKLQGERQDIDRVIPIVDIYQYNPWDLPKLAGEVCRKDPEQWFFFCPMQEREARGGKANRLTTAGYWKATGSPGYVYSSDNRLIGGKKTMVFYKGRACNGIKTKWKLNEYKAVKLGGNSSSLNHTPPKLRQELSLCRIYYTSTSLRAFDRRPNRPVASSPQTTIQDTGSSTSGSQNQAIGQKTSFHEGSWPASSNEEDVSSQSQSQSQSRSQSQSQSVGSGKWNLADISRLLLDEWDPINLC